MTTSASSILRKNINAPNNGENRRRHVENFILVWLSLDTNSVNIISRLREIINCVQMFDNVDDCVNYLMDIHQEKIFCIISEELGEEVVLSFNQFPQVTYIYILRSKNHQSQQSTEQYHKLRGRYETLSQICQQMKYDTQQCSNDLIAMSIIAPVTTGEQENNSQEAAFMYSQLLNEILIQMETTESEVNTS